MKGHLQSVISGGLIFSLILMHSTAVYSTDDIHYYGVGGPPFLTEGLSPNVLLLIDNSASMYDLAYDDIDEPSYCNDNDYIEEYKLQEDSPWVSGKSYTAGTYAYIPVAYTDVKWNALTAYSIGDIIQYDEKYYKALSVSTNMPPSENPNYWTSELWYKATSGGISNGTSPSNDTVVTWISAEWNSATTYAVNDYARHGGDFYKAILDTTNEVPGETPDSWRKVPLSYGGYFDNDSWYAWIETLGEFVLLGSNPAIVTGNDACAGLASIHMINPTYTSITVPVSDRLYSDDICLGVDKSSGDSVVTAIVARGNILNWMTSSKFDIEKKVLTGGKFDDKGTADLTDNQLVMESRGCLGQRMVKQVHVTGQDGFFSVADGAPDSGYLTFAVMGDASHVTQLQILEPTEVGFQLGGTDCDAAINASNLGQTEVLAEDCMLLGKQNESFANSNAAFNHGFQTCWGYPVVGVGDIERMINACENVYQYNVFPTDITSSDSGYVCMGDIADGSGYIGRCLQNLDATGCGVECGDVNLSDGPCDPNVECHPFDHDGDGTSDLNHACVDGFLYACPNLYDWNEATQTCYKNEPQQSPMLLVAGAGDCTITWTANYDTDLDDSILVREPHPQPAGGCIEWANRDYCGTFYDPPVPDADNPVSDIAENQFPNLPAILVDVALNSQLDEPIKTVSMFIDLGEEPEGLIQNVAKQGGLRMGVMSFNQAGTRWECDNLPTVVEGRESLYGCDAANNDAANFDVYLNELDPMFLNGHSRALVDRINGISATSWTPSAEAMYNAIAYYTRKNSYLAGTVAASADDVDPVEAYCQENNIIILTDGSSSADWNDVIRTFAAANSDAGGDDVSASPGCGSFYGSTYLDDLAHYGQSGTSIFANEPWENLHIDDPQTYTEPTTKRNITTYVVTTGPLRTDGPEDECRADVLLNNTAANGGTGQYFPGEDYSELEGQLQKIFDSLRNRASAGSAASVISSARGGEGAIYQAMFWPELKRGDESTVSRPSREWPVAWVGDLHGLFVDNKGFMYEDTDSDRTMTPSEDLDNDGHLDVKEDIDNDGHLDIDEDSNANGVLDAGEDEDNDNHLDVNEDVDGDGHLDVKEDLNNNGIIDGADKRVIIYYDENAGRSKGCYNTSIFDSGSCDISSQVELDRVNFLWSANEWLSTFGFNTAAQRDGDDYISALPRRHIFTWIDLNNDGLVNSNGGVDEVIPFTEKLDWDTTALPVDLSRGNVIGDFNVSTTAAVNDIVSWVRGEDQLSWADNNSNGAIDPEEVTQIQRSRQIPRDDEVGFFGTNDFMTWRLGDIIHSTPMTVTEPAERYHLIYNDLTYAAFFAKYKKRRHVVYFGANDGMLHAVNAGFYNDNERKFCLSPERDSDGNCVDADEVGKPALGSELWAYIPYNLVPHLKSLTRPEYDAEHHKYYVDLRSRIFDVQIFTEEAACSGVAGIYTPGCYHPKGWGTILVGGMRFGGAQVDAATDLSQAGDNRRFISSYFILDITNPEEPPTLLGELTQKLTAGSPDYVDLGYSTVIPTMVIMKQSDDPATAGDEYTNEWYLIFGSGPHGPDALQGVSDQIPRVSVLRLTDLLDADNNPVKSLRISAAQPVDNGPNDPATYNGTFMLNTLSTSGFVSDPITVDFDINPSQENYKSDVVYFGTVEGNFDVTNTKWDGGGILYRLVTRETLAGNSDYGAGASEDPTEPYQWQIKPLIDLTNQTILANGDIHPSQPITASPSVGIDDRKNFWVYFGTGRFFDGIDKNDTTQQTYYGIKEPMLFDPDLSVQRPYFTWEQVELESSGGDPGEKGLKKVDEIRTIEDPGGNATPNLACRDGGDACLDGLTSDTFNSLVNYIAGTGNNSSTALSTSIVDGWYKDFYPYENRERNLGQATLLGGLLTFTTYQPFDDICLAEGLAYLYGVHYQTGTAWYESVFGTYTDDGETYVLDKLSLGRGLAVTPNLHVGSSDEGGTGPKVFIQTSTGEIKEIKQESTPYSIKSGKFKWKEITKD